MKIPGESLLYFLNDFSTELDMDMEELDDIFDSDSEDDSDTDMFRKERWIHQRIDWGKHVAQLIHEERFAREYLMSFEAWTKLHSILAPYLQRNASKSRSIEPVTVDMIIGIGLRYLAGGRVANDRHIFGLSYAEAYRSINDFLFAVLDSPLLTIQFPDSPGKWEDTRRGFQTKSRHNVFTGCVGAVDGFFQKTKAPTKKEAGNVRSYYSGHYESYGLNCQATCDIRLKFLYFGVVAAGSTNDNIAYAMAEDLAKTIDSLPLGMHFVGDAAYTLSERLLIPYTGSQRENSNKDAFNFL